MRTGHTLTVPAQLALPPFPLGHEGALWPLTAYRTDDADVWVGGVRLTSVARQYGTPTYVFDEADVLRRCRDYRRAFDGEVAYAAKAFFCVAMARWVRREGLSLNVCTSGELAVARAAGVPAGRILAYGHAKTPADLYAMLHYGVGRIVLDSVAEVNRLAAGAWGRDGKSRQAVLLRVAPDVDVHGNPASTDGAGAGLALSPDGAEEAAARVLARPELELVGLHCHLGSQVTELGPYLRAVDQMVGLLARIRDRHGVLLDQLDLGGGHPVAYREGDTAWTPADLSRALTAALRRSCSTYRLPVPRLTVEPGRAVVARAGLTLYRVVTVKRSGNGPIIVAVDGGLSDNPRSAQYGAEHVVRLVGRRTTVPAQRVTVVGRHGETDDVIAHTAMLPGDVRGGDLLAALGTGAYHHSMASNYDLVPGPPVVALADRRASLLVRRESNEDLLRRDVLASANGSID
jgi:diaminopimelate decarboxylase